MATGEGLSEAGNFIGWTERIANAVAAGSSADYVRGYLKTTAERTWRLVNWLTHAANATRNYAELALSATSPVIDNYAGTLLKRKVEAPERCGRCKSYKISVHWNRSWDPLGFMSLGVRRVGRRGYQLTDLGRKRSAIRREKQRIWDIKRET